MNQKQIVNAYFTLNRLGSAQLPVLTAYKLFRLRKELEPTCHFCFDQEQAIISRFQGKVENGVVSFSDTDLAQQAQAELENLNAMDVDIAGVPVEIPAADFTSATMSMNDMESLDGFVVLT